MKNTLLFLVLGLATSLAAQSRQDTVYGRWGQIQNIKFFSKMELEKMSTADRFMRGLSFGDEVWELDSIRVHDATGKYARTRLSTDLDPIRKVPSRPRLTEEEKAKQQARKFSDRFSVGSDVVNIAGYAGATATGTLKFWVSGEEAMPLRLENQPDNIKLDLNGKTFPTGAHEMAITVAMKPGVGQQTLRLRGPGQEVFDIHVALRGHDLTEADFVPNGNDPAQLKQFDAREREHLYLRLESTEKLLVIYQGEQLRYRFPVGRQLDQLPVYHLPPGQYRLEIVDLGTGEKRSYGLLR